MGYFLALFIGVCLGLIGGGGSVLTVPLLVYFFDVRPVIATSYSLFIVGISSLIGFYQYYKMDRVDLKTGIYISIPSFLGVFISRKYFLPAIPEYLTFQDISISKDLFIILVFSVLMLFASYNMIKPSLVYKHKQFDPLTSALLIILEGIIVGIITGLVGAGGGFLIIPVLVLLRGLPMKIAVGTSLMIIALKSLVGFTGDLWVGQPIDWKFLIVITVLAVAGIFGGNYLSAFIPQEKLKRGFGWFLVVISTSMLYYEFIVKF